jgi:hypothetical protein
VLEAVNLFIQDQQVHKEAAEVEQVVTELHFQEEQKFH